MAFCEAFKKIELKKKKGILEDKQNVLSHNVPREPELEANNTEKLSSIHYLSLANEVLGSVLYFLLTVHLLVGPS